jgi:hypothetical protein
MLQRLIIVMVMLVSGFASGQCAAQDAIGAVSRIQGEASGTRDGATRALGLNSSVFLNEVVSTAETARLEVTFTDNTQLTLLSIRSEGEANAGREGRAACGWTPPHADTHRSNHVPPMHFGP